MSDDWQVQSKKPLAFVFSNHRNFDFGCGPLLLWFKMDDTDRDAGNLRILVNDKTGRETGKPGFTCCEPHFLLPEFPGSPARSEKIFQRSVEGLGIEACLQVKNLFTLDLFLLLQFHIRHSPGEIRDRCLLGRERPDEQDKEAEYHLGFFMQDIASLHIQDVARNSPANRLSIRQDKTVLKIDELILFLHNMTSVNLFSRYLPVEPSLVDWGMYVLHAGFTRVSSGSSYPAGEHPQGYLFSWDKGRVLDEYQVVYLTDGRGVFEYGKTGPVQVVAGDLMLLRPGLWHRYRPDSEVGWEETWIGFQGHYAHRLIEKFFARDKALVQVGHDEELVRKLQYVIGLMQEAPPGYRQMMAGETVATLARIRALDMRADHERNAHEDKMNQARYHLLRHATEEVDLAALAGQLGLSYSRFRSLFREHTGSSPRRYQIDIRINRARELLRESNHNINEIAELLGFSSVYYFSRLFRQRTGQTPSGFRRDARNRPKA